MAAMTVADELRWARARGGLTQRALAERTGTAQPTIARIERGREMPRVDTWERLLRACGLALVAIPNEGDGVDRSLIRRHLAMTVAQRAAFAQEGAVVRDALSRARPISRGSSSESGSRPICGSSSESGSRPI